jgi:hypothetical protein
MRACRGVLVLMCPDAGISSIIRRLKESQELAPEPVSKLYKRYLPTLVRIGDQFVQSAACPKGSELAESPPQVGTTTEGSFPVPDA